MKTSVENKNRDSLQREIILSNQVHLSQLRDLYKELREKQQLTSHEAYIVLNSQLYDILLYDLCNWEMENLNETLI
jgi:hypothetical protein